MDYKCDVLVCGGGPGGLAAAVSAARLGADILLVERYGFLGGMATAGLVNPFMQYATTEEQIINGIFQEILDRLSKKHAFGPYNSFDAEAFKLVADEMIQESGARLLLHTYVSDVKVSGSLIEEVLVTGKSGPQSIAAQVYVDGTGDADLAFRSGAPCELGRKADSLTQPMTLNFRMSAVDIDRMPGWDRITELYLKAREEGRVDCPRDNVLYFGTTHPNEIHFNTTRIICLNGTSSEDLTKAEIEARRQMWEIAAFLKSDVSGFENAYIQVSASQIGIRETRRIVGEYVMTAEDVLEARKFVDCIARGNYDVDIHDPKGGGTVIQSLDPAESYDIPYRALVPLKIDNLLIAGRPISTTHEAHSSTRIMPIAIAVGEAAGAAAALCTKSNTLPRNIDISVLQKQLRLQGANLGK
jgi:hypothetical protein